jgi:hypothetical protein
MVVLNCRYSELSIEQIQAITGLGEERILKIFRLNGSNDSGSEE